MRRSMNVLFTLESVDKQFSLSLIILKWLFINTQKLHTVSYVRIRTLLNIWATVTLKIHWLLVL